MVQDPHIRRLLQEFESTENQIEAAIGFRSGHVDVSPDHNVRFVVAVDGGQAIVPNEVVVEKRLAFVSVCSMLIRVADIEEMRHFPIIDPRLLAARLQEGIWYNCAVLPLSGVRISGETVKETIRRTVDSVMHYTGLYETLKFLVSREWDESFEMGAGEAPHFQCRNCSSDIYVPRSSISFRCDSCGYYHTLSDYLGIGEESPELWAREEAAIALRNVLETLAVFHFIRVWHREPGKLAQILFIKNGPLLLRARLSRLVEPIRAYFEHLQSSGVQLQIIGIEKNGELANHASEIGRHLPNTGDFFLPSTRYLLENVHGQHFDSRNYRNRVQYGAKVVVRVGPHHVLPLNVPTPTGQFVMDPTLDELIGFRESVSVLSGMVSYQYENALIPLILANRYASVSQQPSGSILQSFSDRLLAEG